MIKRIIFTLRMICAICTIRVYNLGANGLELHPLADRRRARLITLPHPTIPLSRLRDLALITAGIAVTVLAIIIIVLVLVLYPRISRATTNLEQASASAVVVGRQPGDRDG